MNIPQDLAKLFRIAHESDSNILITGRTGTGKTSLAQKIHIKSERRFGPFVTVNLASLHEGTLESELFGHERGAFTGADRKRSGRLEMAHGGTVFLDEVGELSPRMQARLLEFLQSRTLSAVGSNREVHLNVRVIAATHRNLAQAVARGEFREDLFHRLRVVSIPLKCLRDRSAEFDSLVQTCLQEICTSSKRSLLSLSSAVAERLKAYDWPGNIRELRNVLEYSVRASEGVEITVNDLPDWLNQSEALSAEEKLRDCAIFGVIEVPLTVDFHGTMRRVEKEYIARALQRNQGRINRTAGQIGLNKNTLLRRIRAYGIKLT
jgi:DNA-binding NtrC family response regulator